MRRRRLPPHDERPLRASRSPLFRAPGAAADAVFRSGRRLLADYEMLELVLFRAIPRRDVKPLAKALIARFGSFAEGDCRAGAAAAGNRRARRSGGRRTKDRR